MKKIVGKALLLITCTSLLLSSTVLYAGSGKVTGEKITIDNKELHNVASVALVSVYGEGFLLGRKLYQYVGKYAALEEFIKEKVSFLKNNTLLSNQLPFKFLDEQSVLASGQYQMILKDAQKNRGSEAEVNLLSLFTKKDNEDKQPLINLWPGYYLPKDYGVYLADPLNKAIILGNAVTERERIFREMGCDAIYSIGIKMTVLDSGINFFGKENGKIRMEILASVEMPNGKKPYTVMVQAESASEPIFRIPLFAQEQDKELVIDKAMELSDQAWNLAWNTLTQKSQAAIAEYQTSTN